MMVKFLVKGIALLVINVIMQFYLDNAVDSAQAALDAARKNNISTDSKEDLLLNASTYE